MITIDEEEYDRMIEELDFLDALRAAGVDNWEGLEIAIEIFKEGRED